jgi:hypothetical protein
MDSKSTEDRRVVGEINTKIFQTKDYSAFKSIEGNRPLDERHVKELMKNIEKHGNLTPSFPVVVNENIEVIDGQHRIAALQELGWPVFYQVQEGLGLEVVQGINHASRNWSWLDYAESFAAQGNKNYRMLLEAREAFHEGAAVLMAYLAGSKNKGEVGFRTGDFVVLDWQTSLNNLTMLADIREIAGVKTRAFGEAVFSVINSPKYEHNRMLEKLTKYSGRFFQKSYSQHLDYERELEEIYNFHNTEGNIVRLF